MVIPEREADSWVQSDPSRAPGKSSSNVTISSHPYVWNETKTMLAAVYAYFWSPAYRGFKLRNHSNMIMHACVLFVKSGSDVFEGIRPEKVRKITKLLS